MKKALLTLVILSWLLACTGDEPQAVVWHSGADEELIAFLRRDLENFVSRIYVMRPDGSDVQMQGTRAGDVDRNLRWSRDGERLAYLWDTKIYILSETELVRKRFDPPVVPEGFTWSPDGNYFAFHSQHEYYDNWHAFRIYISPANTLSISRTLPLVDTINLWDVDPDWSPDGTKIAFSSDRARDSGRDIYLMNPDGSEVERLTYRPNDKFRPIWSPDGKKIVFESRSAENRSWNIYVMNADGTGIVQVTHNLQSEECHCPSWSPDGTKLAFASSHEGNSEIYTINIDGTGLKRLTNYPGRDYAPSWSPGKGH